MFVYAGSICYGTADSWHTMYGNTSSQAKEMVLKQMEM